MNREIWSLRRFVSSLVVSSSFALLSRLSDQFLIQFFSENFEFLGGLPAVPLQESTSYLNVQSSCVLQVLTDPFQGVVTALLLLIRAHDTVLVSSKLFTVFGMVEALSIMTSLIVSPFCLHKFLLRGDD